VAPNAKPSIGGRFDSQEHVDAVGKYLMKHLMESAESLTREDVLQFVDRLNKDLGMVVSMVLEIVERSQAAKSADNQQVAQ